MHRTLRWIGITGIVLAACTEGPASPDAADGRDGPDSPLLSAAIRSEFPLVEEFDDINPCSGLTMTVSISGLISVIDQDGREIVKQGSVGKECFIIVEGEAAVKRNGRRVATMSAGDHFGELALLDGGPRTATVVAETPLTVLVLGQREFAGLLDEVPGLGRKIMSSLAGWVRELDTKIYT